MPSTFRTDITAGLVTILDAFIAANPTLLRRSERARPASVVGDLPIAFVDTRPESIVHDSGTRTRTMTPSVLVVNSIGDNAETVIAFDSLVDKLVDHFTDYPHITPNTIWSSMSVDDETYSEGEEFVRYFHAVRFSFGNVSIQEGRS
jgi:hypothetical protein